VATFYNMYSTKPVGRHKLAVCTCLPCALRDGAAAGEYLKEKLGIGYGETTADGALTLMPIVCLGHCERAPCLLAGEAVHGPIEPSAEAVRKLVEKVRGEIRTS